MTANLDTLNLLKLALMDGDTCLTDGDTTHFVEALSSAIRDVERIDFMELHGVDWDGIGAYFHSAGSHHGDSLRECVDAAMQSNSV